MNNKIVLGIVVVLVIGAIVLLQEPAPPTTVERVAAPVVKKAGIPAPELVGISGYINTDGITLKELVGKRVVLIDIWTYSCINCQRTLPYLTAWYAKYKDKGLEIIGVHSPEFEFEKKLENVQRAVEKFGVTYPVVLDNDHATWDAYNNRYWPTKYLIDIDGYIVWKHFGEGAYDEAEAKIQELLKERMERLGVQDGIPGEMAEVAAEQPEFHQINTPEIYLGSAFTRGNFGNKEGLPAEQTITYSLPEKFAANQVYLDGQWYVAEDHVKLVSDNGKIVLKYDAKNVNIVAASTIGSGITVFVDDQELAQTGVKAEDLYTIVAGADYGEHTLTIDVAGAGFKLYTFTFG
jgi:thiol-disulfide isomerase/thioredoxin